MARHPDSIPLQLAACTAIQALAAGAPQPLKEARALEAVSRCLRESLGDAALQRSGVEAMADPASHSDDTASVHSEWTETEDDESLDSGKVSAGPIICMV